MRKPALLLLPFSYLYGWATSFRNFLYDRNIRKSVSFEVNVVCVGNLSVGGTGKTPFIEYLLGKYHKKYRISTLSRGYKRLTKGFRKATEEDTPKTIGDEPFQIFSKYSHVAHVAIGEDRETAIPFILAEDPDTELILLDDGFQHRSVTPGLSIVLTRYDRPFFKDHLLPYGRLRERKKEAVRAHIIVITNCPQNIAFEEKQKILKEIRKYSGASVFFGGVKYLNPIPLYQEESQVGENIVLVTGIANAAAIKEYVSDRWNLVEHLNYGDHKHYSRFTFDEILNRYRKAGENCSIITTEKDIVKWKAGEFRELLKEISVFSLPISFKFIEDEERFDKLFTSNIKEYENQF